MTEQRPVLIREYGCTACQAWHRRGIDPMYDPRLYWQSKHGWRDRVATAAEMAELSPPATLAATPTAREE